MSAERGALAPDIAAAVAALRAGDLVAFPTETVYGLGADARNPDALRRVYALKGRPADHPLILHLASVAQLPQWVASVPEAALELARHHWPGPLTLVMPRAAGVSDVLTGGQNTIAVRVPAHPVARALLEAFGGGIAAPSANRYGHVSPTRAAHVREEFPSGIAVILEGGDCEVGLESTIVALDRTPARLLRPGAIGRVALEAVLGPIEVGADAAAPRVPGSTLQHYAPATPVALASAEEIDRRCRAVSASSATIAVLARRAPPPECAELEARGLWWRAPTEASGYARVLYAALRALDKCGAERILVERVPEDPEWDAARDRLQRAAATFI